MSQITSLKKELESVSQTHSRVNKDHLYATEEAYSLKQKVAALESQKNALQAEAEAAGFECERLAKLKRMTEEQLEDVKKELLTVRTENSSLIAQKQKFAVLLEASQKDQATAKEEVAHLVKLREKDKQALLDAEDRERDLTNQLSAAMHNNRVIQKDHQSMSDELVGKMDDMRRVAMMKTSFEQELAELRPLKLKFQQLLEETSSLKSASLNKEALHTRLQRQIDSLEDALRLKDISLGESARLAARYQEEISRLESEIDDLKDHAALINSNVKQTEYLHSETSALKQQLSEYRDKERELIRSAEQFKSELKKAAETIKSMQKQMTRLSELKTNSDQDVEKLKTMLADLQNKELHGQNDFVRLEEKAFQVELLTEELKRQVGLEQHNRYRAEDEVASLKAMLDNEKASSIRMLEQNTQLKSLITNLEKMKEELLRKISSFNSDKNLDEEHKSQLASEVSLLRKELANKTTENSKLTEALKSLDQERDYIQTLLDSKTEENHAVESALSNAQKDLAILKDSINSLQSKDSTSYKRLEEKDFQIKKLTEKSKHLESELEELRVGITSQARQVQELNEHLVALTKENSYVNEQLMKATHEKENLRKFYDDKSRNERLTQQLARSVEREKEDLLLTYKKACEENERLTQAVSAISGEQRETYTKLQACEQELVNAQSHIAMQEHEIFNLQQEVNTLERQISHLTLQLENSEKKGHEFLEIKEGYMREVASARQIALNVEASKDDLIRKMSAAENEKLILESKIRTLQSEVSAVRNQYELEKQKCDDLQMVLAKERDNLFKTQKDLGKLENIKGADDEYISSQLQSTRNQLMNLEMENLKLKEENGRATHKLHKFEGRIKELESQANKRTNAAFRYGDDWDS
jgi:chromosome segregation ATPase